MENGSMGSVYVRWGHDQCPLSAQLVYSGVVSGSEHLEQGGATDPHSILRILLNR